MTIQTDSFNASVDFIYTFNNENTGVNFNLKVRYHMTEMFGETVSIWREISPGDFNSSSMDFPVKFFTEISNLLSKGINIGSTIIKKPIKEESKSILPVTNVGTGTVTNKIFSVEINNDTGNAIESFSSTDNKDKDETDENVIHGDKKEEVSPETLEKEAAEIIEERKQALAKASKNKDAKKISRKE